MIPFKLVFSLFFVIWTFSYNECASASINSANDPSVLDIAAFNVRVFGRRKMSDNFIVKQLVKIILRYDLILIQEIRDSSQKAIHELLMQVNTAAGSSIKYSMALSPRLGRTSSKEQYAFIYNDKMLSVVSKHVYDDKAHDVFEREPYVVQFSSTMFGLKSFAVVGIHTAPKDATAEIDHLHDVYLDTKKRLGIANVILMGDFNAGCTYVTKWSNIRLALDHKMYWLINDLTDTTSGDTECPYDRIVVAGEDQLLDSIEPFSPTVFHYDREYGLTKQQALLVSDHYPVAFKLRSRKEVESITLTRKFKIQDTSSSSKIPLTTFTATVDSLSQNTRYKINKFYDKTGKLSAFYATLKPSDLSQCLSNLDHMSKDFDPLINGVQVSAAKRNVRQLCMTQFLPKNNRVYVTLRDYYLKKRREYNLMVTCDYPDACSVEASVVNGA